MKELVRDPLGSDCVRSLELGLQAPTRRDIDICRDTDTHTPRQIHTNMHMDTTHKHTHHSSSCPQTFLFDTKFKLYKLPVFVCAYVFLGMEPRDLSMLSNCSPIDLRHPQPNKRQFPKS